VNPDAPGLQFVTEVAGNSLSVELPFVIGVVGDFRAPGAAEPAPLSERRFLGTWGEQGLQLADDWDSEACRGLSRLAALQADYPWLRVRALSATRQELLRECQRGDLEESLLFRLVYESEYGSFGGEPYALLVADFAFTPDAADITLLDRLSRLAEYADCSVIAGVDAGFFGVDSWRELAETEIQATHFQTREYLPWRNLRSATHARHLLMALPPARVDSGEADVSACDTAGSIAQGFARSQRRWSSPEPVPERAFDPPASVAAEQGFFPAALQERLAAGSLAGMPTAARAQRYPNPERNPPAQAEVSLAVVLVGCLFMRYLTVITRNSLGMDGEDIETTLQHWISGYTAAVEDGMQASAVNKPLQQGNVAVEAVPGMPGKLYTRLAFRVAGLTTPEVSRRRSPAIGLDMW
jgi:type VI secretion system protein ImpC